MHRVALVVTVSVGLVLAATSLGSLTPRAVAQVATPEAVCPVTTEEENEAVARRWHDEAINQGDLEVLDEITASDIIHHAGTFPDGIGTNAVKSVLGALLTGFPDLRHTIEQVIAKDDTVVIRWQAEGTNDGEFQGHAPTGKTATWTGVNIYRFECGLIAEEWSEGDGLGRLMQLGLIATPTP